MKLRLCAVAALSAGLACSNQPPAETPEYALGGTASGLAGKGLVLTNGDDQLTVSDNGAFTFAAPVKRGSTYSVVVATQPRRPWQTCSVQNGSGIVPDGGVVDLTVTCSTDYHMLRGTVSGLAGTGLVLASDGDVVSVIADGPFVMTTPRPSGAPYTVTIQAQPTQVWQTCGIANASGQIQDADVTDVTVTCSTRSFALRGNVDGYNGHGLEIGIVGNSVAIDADGPFELEQTLLSGTTFAFGVLTQPTDVWQTCTVAQPSGTTVLGSDIDDIEVSCVTNTYTVSGSVTNLEGNGLVVRVGADAYPVSVGSPVFGGTYPSGANVTVLVDTPPSRPQQVCAITAPASTITNADVQVTIDCATCGDGVINGTETDVDCGGDTCRPCLASQVCVRDSDCASDSCFQGRCGAPACDTQNLVTLVGSSGAAYAQLVFPHPGAFPNRVNGTVPLQFLQTAATGGAPNAGIKASIARIVDYEAGGMTISGTLATPRYVSAWSNGTPTFKVLEADTFPFAGFTSTDATSRALDVAAYGATTVPSNATLPSKPLVVAQETPWLNRYGLRKAVTGIDGGFAEVFNFTGAHNHWVDLASRTTVMAATDAIHASPEHSRGAVAPAVQLGDLAIDALSPTCGGAEYFDCRAGATPQVLRTTTAASMLDLIAGASGVSAEDLRPTIVDRFRYGYTGNVPVKWTELRDALIVTAKALRRGLISQVVIGYGNDDPTDLFTPAATTNATESAALLGLFLDAFEDDLMAVPDPRCPQRRLGDNTVINFVGDTARTMVLRNNWSNPTSGGQNRAWVLSNGFLKAGFFGGDRPKFAGDTSGQTDAVRARGPGEGGLWDLTTGDMIPFEPISTVTPIGLSGDARSGTAVAQAYGETAMAGVLYALTRGDSSTVSAWYGGPAFPALISDGARGTCTDGIKNYDETDVDCGGKGCDACGVGKACASVADCGSGDCVSGTCTLADCNDGTQNGNETGVDCGGGCATKCAVNDACKANSDCASGVCQGICTAASCSDSVLDGDETAVDCGGSCPSCPAAQACVVAQDCTIPSGGSAVCLGGHCMTHTATQTIIGVGESIDAVTTGDVDGDSFLDIVTASRSSGVLRYYPGVGDGTFDAPVVLLAGLGEPLKIIAADLNQDSAVDLVVLDAALDRLIMLTSQPSRVYAMTALATPRGPHDVVVGELNGDNHPDAIVAGAARGVLRTYVGTAAGLSVGGDLTGFGLPLSLAIADVDGANGADLLVVDSIGQAALAIAPALIVQMNDGAGNFGAPTRYPFNTTGFPRAIAVAPFDGDAFLDVVVTSATSAETYRFLGGAGGTFGTRTILSTAPARAATAAKLPQSGVVDGAYDLVLLESNVVRRFGSGTGTFSAPQALIAPESARAFAVADIEGDGDLEIIVGGATSSVTVFQ